MLGLGLRKWKLQSLLGISASLLRWRGWEGAVVDGGRSGDVTRSFPQDALISEMREVQTRNVLEADGIAVCTKSTPLPRSRLVTGVYVFRPRSSSLPFSAACHIGPAYSYPRESERHQGFQDMGYQRAHLLERFNSHGLRHRMLPQLHYDWIKPYASVY